jgi:deazaflavin-dependent oxidoreductase (nitroreductase family)
MAAVSRNRVTELFWKLHPWLYRVSGGRIGGKIIGMPVLLLTTRGRKTGEPRTRALTYVPQGNASVVIASFAGESRHPDWWLNLRANPQAEIQRGSQSLRVRAREAQGEERERLWKQVIAVAPDYTTYQERTSRRIPVVVLEPL